MDKYRLVEEHKVESDYGEDEGSPSGGGRTTHQGFPEVRITQQGKPRNYIAYSMSLFDNLNGTIVLKAMGRAINKAVTIAEILKRKRALHQWNSLSSVEMVDVYDPIEEGLDRVESRRYVSCMTITLSKILLPSHSLTTDHIGYQPPLPASEMHSSESHMSPQHHSIST